MLHVLEWRVSVDTHHAAADRLRCGLGAIADAELDEDLLDVPFHRLFRETEGLGNGAIAMTGNEQLQHLLLAFRQRRRVLRIGQQFGGAGGEIAAARMRGQHRTDDLRGVRVFQHASIRAGLERFLHFTHRPVAGQDHRTARRAPVAPGADHIDARAAAEPQIHERDVAIRSAAEGRRRRHIRRLPHDLEVAILLEDRTQTVTDHRVIVGDQESDPTTAGGVHHDVRRAVYQQRQAGFTLAELITVVAIIGILAAGAVPVARFGIRRQNEVELRATLRRITEAIDRYHDLRITGMIQDAPHFGQGEYPHTLKDLVEGVDLTPTAGGKHIRFLRARDLIDPMTGRAEWSTLSDSDDAGTQMTNRANVFEVHSTSTALSLDGKTHYNEW